jgi:hypothetical protein
LSNKPKRGCFNCHFQNTILWKCSKIGEGFGINKESDLHNKGVESYGSICPVWEKGKDLLNKKETVEFT